MLNILVQKNLNSTHYTVSTAGDMFNHFDTAHKCDGQNYHCKKYALQYLHMAKWQHRNENSLNLCLRTGHTGINGYLTVWYCTTCNQSKHK